MGVGGFEGRGGADEGNRWDGMRGRDFGGGSGGGGGMTDEG